MKTQPETLDIFGVFKAALGRMGSFPSVLGCFRVQMWTPIFILHLLKVMSIGATVYYECPCALNQRRDFEDRHYENMSW